MAATLNASGVVYSDGTFTYSTGFNGLGSHAFVKLNQTTQTTLTWASGTNYPAGVGRLQVQSASMYPVGQFTNGYYSNNLSGTWRWLGNSGSAGNVGCCIYYQPLGLAVRVA